MLGLQHRRNWIPFEQFLARSCIRINCGNRISQTYHIRPSLSTFPNPTFSHPKCYYNQCVDYGKLSIVIAMYILKLLCRPEVVTLFITIAFYWALRYFVRDDQPYPGFKIIGSVPGDWFGLKTKKQWDDKASDIMRDGFRKVSCNDGLRQQPRN